MTSWRWPTPGNYWSETSGRHPWPTCTVCVHTESTFNARRIQDFGRKGFRQIIWGMEVHQKLAIFCKSYCSDVGLLWKKAKQYFVNLAIWTTVYTAVDWKARGFHLNLRNALDSPLHRRHRHLRIYAAPINIGALQYSMHKNILKYCF